MREGWETTTLGEAALAIVDSVKPGGEGISYVALEHIIPGQPRIPEYGVSTETSSTTTRFRHGDVLFSKLRPYLNKVAVADRDGVCSGEILVWRSANEYVLSQNYLALVLRDRRAVEYADKLSGGTKMPRTSASQMKQLSVHTPPLAEQHRIVDLIGALDEAIEAAANSVDATETLCAETMTKIVADAALVKATPIGVHADLDLEKVPVNAGRHYPGVGVLNRGRGLLFRDPVTSSSTNYPVLTRLRPEQIVYSKLKAFEGAITVAPIALDARYCSSEFPTFTCKSTLLPEFFRILSRRPELWEQMANRSKGMGGRRERLHPRDFLAMEISVPSVEIQKEAVSMIADIDQNTEALIEMKAVLLRLRDVLLSALLSGEHEIPASYDKFLPSTAAVKGLPCSRGSSSGGAA